MATIAKLHKTTAARTLGIDASTNSIAFCVYWNRHPVRWGKINLTGSSIDDKIADAQRKTEALQKELEVDYVGVEAAVFVQNPNVAIQLAYVFGAILGELQRNGVKVVRVPPLVWQTSLDNPLLTKSERETLKKQNPGKSDTWYKNYFRKYRKQRTMDYFNKRWPMNITDDNIGDACGIARHVYWKLTKREN